MRDQLILELVELLGYFCYGTVFNLSNTAITDIEIKVLVKGLDFALIQRNEPEIIQDLAEFCRRMHTM